MMLSCRQISSFPALTTRSKTPHRFMHFGESHPLRAAIVGASTLKGREIQSVLQDRSFPLRKLDLLDNDEDLGRISEFGGEPVVSLAISESCFEFLDVAFFASVPDD